MSASSASCARRSPASWSSSCSTRPTRGRRDRPPAGGTPGAMIPRTPVTNGPRLSAPVRRSPGPRPTEPPMSQDPLPEPDERVARRQVEITNAYGLHLRPADKFVTLAHKFQSEVRVYYKGNAFNGKSI